MLSWIFIVLAHWNNSQRKDMSLHSDTSFWFRANQSLLFLLNAVCLAEKQQIPIIFFLWFDPSRAPTQDLPHSRWACKSLRHRCGCLILCPLQNIKTILVIIDEQIKLLPHVLLQFTRLIQWNLSKLNLLLTNFCVQNRQTFGFPTLGLYLKFGYTGFGFIQGSVLTGFTVHYIKNIQNRKSVIEKLI